MHVPPYIYVTSRTYSGTTGALSYNNLNQMVEWNAGSTNQEWYVYDAAGNRVLKRSTNSSSTTMMVYAFGREEHQYSGSGTNQANTYYYFLGGTLIGDLNANGTYFLLTDGLGSILSTISWAAGGAAVQGNQLFGPYGKARYYAGNITTAKGFTGQYNDGLTGLDYFHARYYDPVAGVFLSADPVQGNVFGMNPYAYVGGNPETYADPSGQMYVPDPGGNTGGGSGGIVPKGYYPPSTAQVYTPPPSSCGTGNQLDCTLAAWAAQVHAKGTITYRVPLAGDSGGGLCASGAFSLGPGIGISVGPCGGGTGGPSMQVTASVDTSVTTTVPGCATPVCAGGPDEGEKPAAKRSAPAADAAAADAAAAGAEGCGGGLSFSATTKVATAQGEQAIGTIHPGEKVEAYNPQTHQMELQPVLHVWINHDNDLVDLTLTTRVPATHGKPSIKMSEVIHTNKKHPFLTKEKGFLAVGQIKLGIHMLRADGTYGVVTGWKVVPGTRVMYNLEVAQDHTFTVGAGQWVVHNCAAPTPQHLDVVPYDTDFPPRSGFQKHHGVLDIWASENIPGYVQGDAPSVVLTNAEHNATRSYFASWRIARTGSLGGYIDWRMLPPREVQDLAYGMFNAAGVPDDVVVDYFQAFHQYIYSLP
jgi:RHS repeat-associated protein